MDNMTTRKGNLMKEKIWAALIISLMLVFWAFALAGPVISEEPHSSYTLLTCERVAGASICVPGR